jgi:hypothetical protein
MAVADAAKAAVARSERAVGAESRRATADAPSWPGPDPSLKPDPEQAGGSSARRPLQLSAGEEVDVEVRHGLAGLGAVVHHQTKPALELELAGDFAGREEEVAEDGLIGGRCLANARDHLLRNDQQMHWRLRLDVVDHDAVFILVLDARGDLAVDDFLEKRFHAGDWAGTLVGGSW